MTEIAEPGTAVPDVQGLSRIATEALDKAAGLGASAAEVGVSRDSGLSVNVRMGEVDTLEYHRDKNFAVTVYFGHRKGSASSTDFRPDALTSTVRAACDIARFTAEDECAGLADPELMAAELPDLDLYHPWDLDAAAAIEQARACEQFAREYDARISNSEGASVSSHGGASVYANSHGFVGTRLGTRHSLSCSVVAASGGGMQRDYWYSVARDSSGLETPEQVGRRAAERTLRRLDARSVKTGSYPVVFSNEMARSLIGHLVAAVRGGALYRKASFLLDHLGRQIMPSFVQIGEHPLIRGAMGSAAFDNEGVATRERDLVSAGVLQGYVLDSYSARKLGTRTTGNAGGVHNLILQPGPHSPSDLLGQMGTGLLVTEMMGMGVNIVTGDYSRGAAGFWVENGEIAYPVDEVTVAGRLQDILLGVAALGDDLDRRGSVQTPSILVERMTVAGSQ